MIRITRASFLTQDGNWVGWGGEEPEAAKLVLWGQFSKVGVVALRLSLCIAILLQPLIFCYYSSKLRR